MAATLPLPIELVSDILSRLPAKSSVRLRSVWKEWSSLCFDPSFEKLRHRNHQDWKLVARGGLLYSLDLGSLDCALRADHILHNSNFKVKKVLGCSTGKLCLSVSDNNPNPAAENYHYPVRVLGVPPIEPNNDIIVICDLSTGARHIVPPSPVDFQAESLADVPWRNQNLRWGLFLQRHLSYGFGFDPSGEDYKLVRISQYMFIGSFPNYLVTEAKVYSMKTDSWSRVDQDTSKFCINDLKEPVLVEGVLYWVAGGSYTEKTSDCDMVVAFDLAEGSFRSIAHVDEFEFLCLGSMGGKLCVLSCESESVKLWRVEDRGDVWTPLASFAREVGFPRPFFVCSQAMTFSKNGDKVLVDNVCRDLAEETAGMCQVKFI